MHTIKPLDKQSILKAAEETGRIVTAEEHHVTGGLGGAIAELLAEFHPTPMRFVGMPDEFAVVGPTAQVRAKYGMCASNIMSKCAELLKYWFYSLGSDGCLTFLNDRGTNEKL